MVEEPFEWDEANTAHPARHRVTPQEVGHVVRNGPFHVNTGPRSGELRRREHGITRDNRVLVASLETAQI